MLPGHRCTLKTIIQNGTNTANKEIHRDKAWKRPRNGENRTHYRVSGGPMMVACHSKTLLSSTSPAENPSTGCLARSAPHTPQKRKPQIDQLINPRRKQKKKKSSGNGCRGTQAGRTSELLLEEEARLAGGGRHERRSVAGLGFCGARNDSRSRDKYLSID